MTSRVWNLATYMMMPHLARSLLWNMREHLKRGEVKIIGMSPRGCRMRRTVDVFYVLFFYFLPHQFIKSSVCLCGSLDHQDIVQLGVGGVEWQRV